MAYDNGQIVHDLVNNKPCQAYDRRVVYNTHYIDPKGSIVCPKSITEAESLLMSKQIEPSCSLEKAKKDFLFIANSHLDGVVLCTDPNQLKKCELTIVKVFGKQMTIAEVRERWKSKDSQWYDWKASAVKAYLKATGWSHADSL